MNKLCVAFCVNRLMLGSMCVALNSLVRHYSGNALRIYILHPDLSRANITAVTHLFDGINLCFKRIDVQIVSTFRSLHGDRTTYGKLFIPDLICADEDFVVYLDSDLLVLLDLNELHDYLNGQAPIFAVNGSEAQFDLDCETYSVFGIQPNHQVFNAGVMVFNVPACRRIGLLKRAKEVYQQFRQGFLAADQPMFNVLFRDSVGWLPQRFNVPLYPDSRVVDCPKPAIYHFVGSPKPWDLFASRCHSNYRLYQEYSESAPIPPSIRGRRVTLRTAFRTARLARSYWRAFQAARHRKPSTC